jgi:hypothetical protein
MKQKTYLINIEEFNLCLREDTLCLHYNDKQLLLFKKIIFIVKA